MELTICGIHCLLKETGEVADETELYLDEERINEESKFDGYSCIITSELIDYKR